MGRVVLLWKKFVNYNQISKAQDQNLFSKKDKHSSLIVAFSLSMNDN